jgi:hypothetical protein
MTRSVTAILYIAVGLVISFPLVTYAQQGYLVETPAGGFTESGVGVIAGWHCTASVITIEIDGTSIGKAGIGTYRPELLGICGHVNSGFSALYNWNKLPPGQHTVTLHANGVEIDRKHISTIQSAGGEYVTGLQKIVTVPDFPSAGKTAAIEWREATQSFVVSSISETAGLTNPDLRTLNGTDRNVSGTPKRSSSCPPLAADAEAATSATYSASISSSGSNTVLRLNGNGEFFTFNLLYSGGNSVSGFDFVGTFSEATSNLSGPAIGLGIKVNTNNHNLTGYLSLTLDGCTTGLTLN